MFVRVTEFKRDDWRCKQRWRLEEQAAPPGGGASEKVAMPGALGWTELPALPRQPPGLSAPRLHAPCRCPFVCRSPTCSRRFTNILTSRCEKQKAADVRGSRPAPGGLGGHSVRVGRVYFHS